MINFPIDSIRKDFPILGKKINNHDIVYFDNAATTQKPDSVINAISDFIFDATKREKEYKSL